MGEMADLALDEMLDPYWDDYGGHSPFGVKECRYCGALGLHWKQLANGRWRLFDEEEEHHCPPLKGPL